VKGDDKPEPDDDSGHSERIGEVVEASVQKGIEVKLSLDGPEELKVGYPVMVEGRTYDFYCLVSNVYTPSVDVVERLAGADLDALGVPTTSAHGFSGPLFYVKALLRPIQLINRVTGAREEPETIPPYFAPARFASRDDVNLIYVPSEKTLPFGTLRGVKDFEINYDFEKLCEKPFALFGRTGMGKSILCKIVCSSIISRGVASVLVFDMHGEYGMFSQTDDTPGLKFFFTDKVETLTLDAEKNPDARPFALDPNKIEPADLIVAFQDLSPTMVDTLYAMDRRRGARDILGFIRDANPDEMDSAIHPSSLQALQRRVSRLERFGFVRPVERDASDLIASFVEQGRSVVLDFGRFGGDQTAYLFCANVLARRLYQRYIEAAGGLQRLVLFLEEAHKFLSPQMAGYTIFDRLARETRKFNLILAIVDQRPSRIDEEVRSQLANRLVLSIKEPSDLQAALAGVPDRGLWENIVSTIPARTVVALGDAITVPTVIDVLEYSTNLKKLWSPDALTSDEFEKIADRDLLGKDG